MCPKLNALTWWVSLKLDELASRVVAELDLGVIPKLNELACWVTLKLDELASRVILELDLGAIRKLSELAWWVINFNWPSRVNLELDNLIS